MNIQKLIYASLFILMAIACAENAKSTGKADDMAVGVEVYKKYCLLCHGADGKLGLNGAKDITTSTMTLEERVALISAGKNTMTPFEGILTPDQMRAVATYTMNLKQ